VVSDKLEYTRILKYTGILEPEKHEEPGESHASIDKTGQRTMERLKLKSCVQRGEFVMQCRW